jgi:hypothetical protein
MSVAGNCAQDEVNWGPFRLPAQRLLEVNTIGGGFTSWPSDYDGALGLSPFDVKRGKKNTDNILQALFQRMKAGENIFAMGLSTLRESGELFIGNVPMGYSGLNRPFIRVPIQAERSFQLHTWLGPLSSIAYLDKRIDFDSSYLGFALNVNLWPVIYFPEDITAAIYCRAQESGARDGGIACNKRHFLPSVSLEVGGEQPLVMTGYDYTIETDYEGTICQLVVLSIKRLPSATFHPKFQNMTAVLSWPALTNWLSAFDLDRMEIKREFHLPHVESRRNMRMRN